MSSSSENKNFRQLENYFNIIFDPSSSENQIMNIRSKLGLILYFCCIKDPARTLNNIVQKMELMHNTPGISMILLSCACYSLQFIPHINSSENFTKITSWIEAPLLHHAVFEDSNNIFNLSRFLQAGGSKMLPCADVILCELLLRHEIIGTSIAAKPIALLIDLNPETNSSIFWRLFNPEYETVDDFFLKNEPLMTLTSKIVSNSKLIPPADENKFNILLKSCEHNCLMIENTDSLNNKDNDTNSILNGNIPKTQLKFHLVEISLTILRWLIMHERYCPKYLSSNYDNTGLDCLVVECWAEYAKYGDLSRFPKFDRSDRAMQTIYLKIIKNALMNPNFSFESISINHWLWHSILDEFNVHQIKKNIDVATVKYLPSAKPKENQEFHSLYELTSNELINCSGIASILPEWFFIHCLRFKCRNSEISIRLLSIISDLPTSILIDNFEDFIDFIMYHITTFPQNASLIADCVRDLITVLLPRMNPLIERIIDSMDYFDESNLTPRLILLNTIFCFGVEADSFADVFDNLIESIPFLEGTFSLSLCTSLLTFFSHMTFYIDVDKYGQVLFNISMAVICATYSSCAVALNGNNGGKDSDNNSSVGRTSSNANSSGVGGKKNMQIRRTMSAVNFKLNSPNDPSNSPSTLSPLFVASEHSNGGVEQSSLGSPRSRNVNPSYSINDFSHAAMKGQAGALINDSILIGNGGNDSIVNGGCSNEFFSPINVGCFVGQSSLDFSLIEEPSFVSRCDKSHTVYTSCVRFYSVTSSDLVTTPTFTPSQSFTLTPLALQLILKLPTSIINKDLEGLSMLIDFLPSFLSLFPSETVSLVNFLIENGCLSAGKNLSLLCAIMNQELSHNESFNFVIQMMKFGELAKMSPGESIALKPINVKTLSDDIDSTRIALQVYPEIIPLIVMKGSHLSLLLELSAPKIDNSLLAALSAEAQQTKSCHELRQIRSLLAHFNFKQPAFSPTDSWLKRDFCIDEFKGLKNNLNQNKLIGLLSKSGDDEDKDAAINTFARFFPIDSRLKSAELVLSVVKSYKLCPDLSPVMRSIISPYLSDCVRLGKDKFWLVKYLFVNGVKFDFPRDSDNEKVIEFGLRNGYLPRSMITSVFKLKDTAAEASSSAECDGEESNEAADGSDGGSLDEKGPAYDLCLNEAGVNGGAAEEEDDLAVKDWMWIDRLYLLLPPEIDEIWPNCLADRSRILSSIFLPKRAIVPRDFLLRLVSSSSSLPSSVSASSSSQLSSSSSVSSSLFFTTTPCCVSQHIYEYLLILASSSPDDASQFFSSNEGQIVSLIGRVDIRNQLVFESLFTFVSSLILMFGGAQKRMNSFVLRFAEVFLKLVFSFEAGIYSACVYDALPMLKKILEVLIACGKKFKPNDPIVQFLASLKKGIPSVGEYIPDYLVE